MPGPAGGVSIETLSLSERLTPLGLSMPVLRRGAASNPLATSVSHCILVSPHVLNSDSLGGLQQQAGGHQCSLHGHGRLRSRSRSRCRWCRRQCQELPWPQCHIICRVSLGAASRFGCRLFARRSLAVCTFLIDRAPRKLSRAWLDLN